MGRHLELQLGNPGHGGFVIARHEGRVVFVRHGLPGERVTAVVTEDRGGSFCRADAIEIRDESPERVTPVCPISGPGGAGCCDFSHASLRAQREMKSQVVSEQLARLARVRKTVDVEELPGTGDGTGWRNRVRLVVDEEGHPGYHVYRSSGIVTDLACPQIKSGAYDGVAEQDWNPGSEVQIAVDGAGERHIVEIAPPKVSKTGRTNPGRRGTMARRTARGAPRTERVVRGSGRPVERVGDREWSLAATGFWQAHRGAAETYSEVVAEWAEISQGDVAWDLYGGVGVFAAALADACGASGHLDCVESSRQAVADGKAALADLPQVHFHGVRVERAISTLRTPPRVVVLDPPRSGAGPGVIDAVTTAGAERIVHVGCDPASFARDIGLYLGQGYRVHEIRAFDAFPLTHHVECLALLVRADQGAHSGY